MKLIDVREPNEWERDHLANATLIPLAKLMQQPGALTDDNVVFYCEMGHAQRGGLRVRGERGARARLQTRRVGA